MSDGSRELSGTAAQVLWSAIGGALPLAAQVLRKALVDPGASIPSVGSFFVVGVVICVLLGVIAGFAFRPHNILAALYHGATAPLTFAFVVGIDVHK